MGIEKEESWNASAVGTQETPSTGNVEGTGDITPEEMRTITKSDETDWIEVRYQGVIGNKEVIMRRYPLISMRVAEQHPFRYEGTIDGVLVEGFEAYREFERLAGAYKQLEGTNQEASAGADDKENEHQ
jgi:hypothetical protein